MHIESLNYPFDIQYILRKRKSIKSELCQKEGLTDLKIAILGGSTTSEIVSIFELFLLKEGFRPTFYESEYGKYYEDVLIDDTNIRNFRPDIAFIHTTHVNLLNLPELFDTQEKVDFCLKSELDHYYNIWNKLTDDIGCLVIQNNFDLFPIRSLGGLDSTVLFGKTNFITRLNLEFASAARLNPKLIINDIHYLSAQIGLNQWFDTEFWLSYKMAVSHVGTINLAHSLTKLVRAALGNTRKCLVLDLDNTLWGGVIGDDGMHGIQLGKETAQGEAFTAFQLYCEELNKRGILLAVCSKNELINAQQGFTHPDTVLKLKHFTSFQANWEPKPNNIERIATEINIGIDSLVFIDDNPAERALVFAQLPQVAVPNVGSEVIRFAEFIDREGYFEVTGINTDDEQRSSFYADNNERITYQKQFTDYSDFLASLDMKAEIGAFSPTYIDRIAQLTNKTNQFNLTTKRYTLAEIESIAKSPEYITLYGRLADRFGDNGLVTIVSGKINAQQLHIDLWLMSCRVLKRDMEHAMLDALVAKAIERGVIEVLGYYYRTQKNDMVADHFSKLGFDLVAKADDDSNSTWKINLKNYVSINRNIKDITYV